MTVPSLRYAVAFVRSLGQSSVSGWRVIQPELPQNRPKVVSSQLPVGVALDCFG